MEFKQKCARLSEDSPVEDTVVREATNTWSQATSALKKVSIAARPVTAVIISDLYIRCMYLSIYRSAVVVQPVQMYLLASFLSFARSHHTTPPMIKTVSESQLGKLWTVSACESTKSRAKTAFKDIEASGGQMVRFLQVFTYLYAT